MKQLIDSEKERPRESRALRKIDGKVAQEERVHLVYLISQASRLRGEEGKAVLYAVADICSEIK